MKEKTSPKRHLLYKGYNFLVEIKGLKDPISFTKVSSLERGIGTESYQEGGLNSRVRSLASAIGSERMMTCERGVMSAADQEAFATITDSFSCDISIAILNDAGKVSRYYSLSDCMLKSVKLGELNAAVSGVLVETLEFIYGEIDIN